MRKHGHFAVYFISDLTILFQLFRKDAGSCDIGPVGASRGASSKTCQNNGTADRKDRHAKASCASFRAVEDWRFSCRPKVKAKPKPSVLDAPGLETSQVMNGIRYSIRYSIWLFSILDHFGTYILVYGTLFHVLNLASIVQDGMELNSVLSKQQLHVLVSRMIGRSATKAWECLTEQKNASNVAPEFSRTHQQSQADLKYEVEEVQEGEKKTRGSLNLEWQTINAAISTMG